MTVKLTSNFLTNARGLTFKDGGGIDWSVNANTNELTATGSAGGVISTITLADDSTAPIYSGSTLTGNGTLSFTLKTQSANIVLAGPGSGSAAQPTFRALVAADIPTIPASGVSGLAAVATTGAYSSLSGTPTIPSGANPSGSVGLSAVNGSSTSFMRADAAPALSQSIAPTWTGKHTFTPGSGMALQINAPSGGGIMTWLTGSLSSSQNYSYWIGPAQSSGQSGGLIWENNGGTPYLHLDTYASTAPIKLGGSSVTVTSTFAINNGTPTAALSGFGSPSGTPTSGLTNGATLAQTAGTLAALLAYLKTIGFIAA